MKNFFLFLIYLFYFIQTKKITILEEGIPKTNKTNGIIHFINCGRSDSILIEQNGKFGLIDASRRYTLATDVVESSGYGGTKKPNGSVKAVVNYLNHLGVTHLDFVLATHAHTDHIGGMPQIAYHFVDKRTKFLYKKYRKNLEDNEVYFNDAYNSMQKKGAQLIDVTDQKYEFDFGDMHFDLINTEIHKKEEKRGENQNCIGTIITYKNKRIFLASDLLIKEDLIYKDYIGKIDVLKMAHHGIGCSSFDFLNATRPNFTIITNNQVQNLSIVPISIIQQIFGGKVYYVGGVSTTTKNVSTSAIRLYLSENVLDDSAKTKYFLYLENTGTNINIGKDLNGFQTHQSYNFYFENGKILKGLQILEGENGKCRYYFESDGHMIKGTCLTLKGKSYCFDVNGCCYDL